MYVLMFVVGSVSKTCLENLHIPPRDEHEIHDQKPQESSHQPIGLW